jgi:DNA polymerase elongation subunit (family B)
MKILLYDIETSPNLVYCWDIYEQNALSVEKQRELISFAWKWKGERSVHCLSKRTLSEKQLVKRLHDLFNEADILVAHNGDAFDAKMANAFFAHEGLTPPSPYKSVDTLKIARSKFRFNSNKLNDLGKYLGLGEKVDTGGFKLWLECLKGKDSAWRKMEFYNKQDVELLEKVYDKLSPWRKTPPVNHGMECPNCGSTHLQSRGWNITQLFKKKRFQCQSCGKWCESNNKIKIGESQYTK